MFLYLLLLANTTSGSPIRTYVFIIYNPGGQNRLFNKNSRIAKAAFHGQGGSREIAG